MITKIITLLLIVLFAYTGMSKLLTRLEFTQALRLVPVLKPMAGVLSWTVPSAELITAALVCMRATRGAGLLSSTFLMAVFTFYVVIILSGDNLPCTCGGILQSLTWQQHLWVNIFFLGASAYALYQHYTCTYQYLSLKKSKK